MPSFVPYPPSSRIALGPLRIDLRRETVEVAGDAGSLTPRAEQLLLLFARYPNLLVTRDQILDTVWAGRVVEDAAISHCVWQIRKLLGEDGKRILQTRARRGYVLAVDEGDWLPDVPAEPLVPTVLPETVEAVAADAKDATVAPADPVEPPPVAQASVDAAPPRRARRIVLFSAGAFALVLLAAIAWRFHGDAPAPAAATDAPIALAPEADLKLALSVPKDLDWLRASLLRDVVDHAYLRGSGVVLLQAPPKTDPFLGPLLRIEVVRGDDGDIVAELALDGDGRRAQRRFVGPPSELRAALDALLDARLSPAKRRSSPVSDAIVAGRAADLVFDGLAALGEYRRALGLDPTSVDARLAMAERLSVLGDSLEAERMLDAMRPDAGWTAAQRCAHALLVADAAPERLPADACEPAQIRARIGPDGAGEARRRLDAMSAHPMGASAWVRAQAMAIEARQYLGQHAEAEGVSADAERIAGAAGWRWAQWRLAAERCKSVLYTGRNEDGLRLCNDSADGLEAAGDGLSALAPRIFALTAQRPEPGPATTAQRAQYRTLVDRARALGSPFAEVWALDGVMALDRDDPARWAADKARIEALIAQHYAPTMRARVQHDLITEDIARRQYRAVLAKLTESGESPDALGTLYLRAQALFALDDLPGAVAQIDAMEKHGYDIAETNPCLFAWLFVETGDAARARVVLKGCPFETWEPASIGGLRGDWGLLAKAGLSRLAGEPQRAWPMVRPRIEALLATPDLGRLDAEALAFLARHATEMPGADLALLKRALARTSALSERDGAGPNLRFGVHVLRWRLCRAERRSDCGPVLPAWAGDDRFEARLARRFADALPARR